MERSITITIDERDGYGIETSEGITRQDVSYGISLLQANLYNDILSDMVITETKEKSNEKSKT